MKTILMVVLPLAFYVWSSMKMAKLFTHLGIDGWKGWVPFVTQLEMLKLVSRPATQLALITFVPVYGWVVYYRLLEDMCTHCGQPKRLAGLGFFLPPLWAPKMVAGTQGRRDETSMLRLTGVSKTFYPGTANERVALRGIDLELQTGDFVTIIGSNGAGKSTLLNIIGGSLPVDRGVVLIDGKDVTKQPAHRRAAQIARVFQDPQAGTAPHLTIEQNLAVALNRGHRQTLGRGLTKAKRAAFAEHLATLEQGLENRMNHRVGLLSGGQRQALSLLMATFTRPDLLLLDEHTAALDPERAELVLRLTSMMIEDHHLTALMVTHNMDHALRMGNRLVMMHEGEIVRSLGPEEKANATVADLLDLFATKGGLSDRTLLT